MSIKKYIKMVEELKAYGESLIDRAYEEYDEEEIPQWINEVECMDVHLDCALSILREEA